MESSRLSFIQLQNRGLRREPLDEGEAPVAVSQVRVVEKLNLGQSLSDALDEGNTAWYALCQCSEVQPARGESLDPVEQGIVHYPGIEGRRAFDAIGGVATGIRGDDSCSSPCAGYHLNPFGRETVSTNLFKRTEAPWVIAHSGEECDGMPKTHQCDGKIQGSAAEQLFFREYIP